MVYIGVLGGTGPAGRAVAARLASVGIDVTVGSRSLDRARATCDTVCKEWSARALPLVGGENADAAAADLVIVATPWEAAPATVAGLAPQLEGKVLVSMANAVARLGEEFVPLLPPRGSVAASVQAAVPRSMVAAAFHHLPARELLDLDHDLDGDVLVCSDHPEAIAATAELITKVPGLRAINAGLLSAAMALEAFTPVLLNINRHYRTRTSIRLTNLEVR
jgi:8-hydroxy-5-deazaflavin:NADPH oxidoreductase